MHYIQELLGHAHSKTTEIYTYVSTKSLVKIQSPLDTIKLEKGVNNLNAKGRNCAFARGGISETGSDIIPNSDKKRNRGAFVNEPLIAGYGKLK